ncbi:hypothetical protein GW17_00010711 [Ensete ventricosum]|nr:hypothetical protein GW17_00010711 [Ensete ventricosum]
MGCITGVFSYLSYRDPNLLKTLDVYDGTDSFLRELQLDDDTLTKAIIGTIGDVDAYQLPDAKGYSSLMRYLLGVTEEERKRRREEILSTSLKDFKEFADAIEAVKNSGVMVAVASPEDRASLRIATPEASTSSSSLDFEPPVLSANEERERERCRSDEKDTMQGEEINLFAIEITVKSTLIDGAQIGKSSEAGATALSTSLPEELRKGFGTV